MCKLCQVTEDCNLEGLQKFTMSASQLLGAKVLHQSLSKSGIAKHEASAELSLVGTYCRERKAVKHCYQAATMRSYKARRAWCRRKQQELS